MEDWRSGGDEAVIQPIVRDMMFLQRKSTPATVQDAQVITDLRETLLAHRNECVGMAANMIGVSKRIIAVMVGSSVLTMVNPVIVAKQQPFSAQESCLSLDGVRACIRYRKITVQYQDEQFAPHTQEFSGFVAQIIQHEADHLEGILI